MAGANVKMKKRLNMIIAIAVLTAFVIISCSLLRITVFQHDFYTAYANNLQMRKETITANRGTIYDRNMNILAQSATVWDVTISPKDIKSNASGEELAAKQEKIALYLSDLLDIDKASILLKMEKNSQYEVIKKQVEKTIADPIRTFISDNNYSYEINLVETSKRYYPNNSLASSVLGFTGSDSQGLYGIEYQYDSTLAGVDGSVITLRNAKSEAMPASIEQKTEAQDGNSLRLTIDVTIQNYLENALSQVMTQLKPKNGCCGIVMNVNSGEVYAMANYPNFNLNEPYTITDQSVLEAINALSEDEQSEAKYAAQMAQWSNKCVSYTYEPGSVFKTVTASAAFEEKAVSLEDTFTCTGKYQVADRTMKCHNTSGHGVLDFTKSLVHSCNPSFIQIGARLGAAKFFRYFEAFGLTEKTGIDLPGEQLSNYYTADELENQVRLASCSFGQSSSVTPIQMVTAVSAVVNGGKLVTPYVVKEVLDSDKNVVKSTTTTVKRQVISEATSEVVSSMMQAVVEMNSGSNAAVKGYKIGGKSGTSQKLASGSTEGKIASYVAVAPIDNPEIIVYIMVDEPTVGVVLGSVNAAPAAAAVMSDTLPYLGFSPEYSEEELASLEVVTPTLTGLGILQAQSRLSANGLGTAIIKGGGGTVKKQVPAAGEKIARDGQVILYTDDTDVEQASVPNVVGLSPGVAKQRLKALGFNVRVSGGSEDVSGSYIRSQSVVEGEKLDKGEIIEIICVNNIAD